MGDARIQKNNIVWKILWKKSCRKTTAEMKTHQEELSVAPECGRMKEASRG
jgi:hypothetical protein